MDGLLGGPKGMLPTPLSNYWGGGPGPPCSNAYVNSLYYGLKKYSNCYNAPPKLIQGALNDFPESVYR